MAFASSNQPPLSTKKIWVAISTPFQVNFFHPLIKRLESQFEFLITARNHDRIFSMLEAKDIDYIPTGKHGGTTLEGRLQAYAETIQQLAPIVKREKPDLLLTERWPEAVRVAFGLNIPAWTIYYDEREYHVNRMVFPLSSKVFAPSYYTVEELRLNGVFPESISWFQGFHTCYLKGEETRNSNLPLKNEFQHPVILVRPEPELAMFFPQKSGILEKTVDLLTQDGHSKDDFTLLVFPRTKEQSLTYAKYPVTVFSDATAANPVFYADITLGAAETMLMESLVLGKPAVSTVYWKESKPLTELHKHIIHTTDPFEAAYQTTQYLDSEKREEFRRKTSPLVNQMDNPVLRIEEEIHKLFGTNPKSTA